MPNERRCGTCAKLEYYSDLLEGGLEVVSPECPHRDGVAEDDAACRLYEPRPLAGRDEPMDGRVPADARWWRCQACGASYVMERGVRPLWCPMCGARYGWPDFERLVCQAGKGEDE